VLIDADNVKWHYPADRLVDLAVTPANFDGPLYFPADKIFSQQEHGPTGIGDFCYTAGLFHFVAGHTRNLPFLFTGHITLMPPQGETIPIGNGKDGIDLVEGYLIENNAINGTSGAPVFVRPTHRLKVRPQEPNHGVMTGDDEIYLLGVYQAAWFLPPDAILRQSVMAKANDVVPVGIGVVVPVHKLVELLETRELIEMRAKSPATQIIPAIPTGVSAPGEDSHAKDANPQHREYFTSLINAAARKPPQGD
jgi:hypothetical protein